MRHTFTFQRSQTFARARAGERNLPALMTCRDALEFATIAGARCAYLDGKVGTLTPAKEADLVLLRADDPTVWPVNNAPGTVVNMMNPTHIDAVFIAGKVRKWRGKLVGVDIARVMASPRRHAIRCGAGPATPLTSWRSGIVHTRRTRGPPPGYPGYLRVPPDGRRLIIKRGRNLGWRQASIAAGSASPACR